MGKYLRSYLKVWLNTGAHGDMGYGILSILKEGSGLGILRVLKNTRLATIRQVVSCFISNYNELVEQAKESYKSHLGK